MHLGRAGALMQAVATASAALLRGGSGRATRAPTLRMSQINTDGLGAPDICVLGGGFGGLYTALRLSKLDWGDAPRPRVTLVDQQERFVFLPMLYEVATGSASCWEVTLPFAQLLAHCPWPSPWPRPPANTVALTAALCPNARQVAPPFTEVLAGSGVEFVRGTVAGLDPETRMVRVATGADGEGGKASERLLPYDACVLALGSRAAGVGRVPGAEAHARQFYTLDDALALRQELQARALGWGRARTGLGRGGNWAGAGRELGRDSRES